MPRQPLNGRHPRFRSSLRVMLVAVVSMVALILNVVSFASNTRTAPRAAATTAPAPAAQNNGQGTEQAAARPEARAALQALQSSAGGQIVTLAARETGAYSFVRAGAGSVLVADDAKASPEERAFAFLAQHGALVGMNSAERALAAGGKETAAASQLQTASVIDDEFGIQHVKLNQFYQGLAVFGAQIIVHMNGQGITAVNGSFVPDVAVKPAPGITAQRAGQIAVSLLRKQLGNMTYSAGKTELSIYRTGLLEGYAGQNVLAYSVEVSGGPKLREQVWLNAQTGAFLNRISLVPDALYRIVHAPQYDSANPDLFVVRKEGDPPSLVPVVNDLYDFTGQTYNFYASAFGRDSYDAAGHKMRTVYLVNQQCPNAYWDGQTTNYCPDITADDVVSHEWSHAYTQYTHGLIYSYQSGALNEAYSDIFGETVDLINGVDGSGGNNNTDHAIYDDSNGVPMQVGGGQRFRIGEDVQSLNQPALGILRDMYQPAVFGNADKVSSTNYTCGSTDNGGVHNNSGVPNHGYALLVDGGTFNGQTITGIGLTKAAAIYFRAESVYQVPTTNFANHEQSLRAAAADLIGAQLYELSTANTTRTPSNQTISQADITELGKAMAAVEMSSPASQCGFVPLLNPDTPAACAGNTTVFADDFEDGSINDWTLASTGVNPGWPNLNWTVKDQLPQSHPGKAAFAVDPPDGVCLDPNGDFSGRFSMDSPAITVPAGAGNLKMSFEHFVETEADVDGGNVYISVNGGAFSLIPKARYSFNPYNTTLRAAPPADQNTNPKAGEDAFSGSNIGTGMGSWGTSIVDLQGLATPGQTVKVRFEFGLDGCGGGTGWLVDNFRVYYCPTLSPPTLTLGQDYENPDTNGSYTLNWTRPAGAAGPDILQESSTSCGPLLSDNAENGLSNWVVTTDLGNATIPPSWDSAPANAKPQYNSQTFWAHGAEQETQTSSAMLTYKNPITMPAAGTTTLNFSQWYFNEDDDKGLVEVSDDNGATWAIVYTNNRAMGATPDEGALAFAQESLTPQSVNLSAYNGKTIRLRFRYALGVSNFFLFTQYGWYLDNITLNSDNWSNVTSTSGTSHTVSNVPVGTRCYQVRTSYNINGQTIPSAASNSVQAVTANTIPGCSLPLPLRIATSDFDGDGKTDISIWQPNSGNWTIVNSSNNSSRTQPDWGRADLGDVAVPGDYDGDRKTDIAIFRKSEGNWYIIQSSTGGVSVQNWGGNGDRPVPADYDGDGTTDLAVFRSAEGNWYVRKSTGGSLVKGWGDPTDKPVPGDYDRDGKADIAVWRPSDGNWYIIQSGTNTLRIQQWGLSDDKPVQGDYDGDGKTDVAIYRPGDGMWYITASCALASGRVKQWGNPGDVPVPGDYDGDGKTDIAVFRPSDGNWFILLSSTNTHIQPNLGFGTDTPTPATYIP
ncbi:MAG TPA: M4 family metallopeptidase [Pyrinomonadaceae bacterium]